jgi:pyridoxamine 5'-phosphate oxidase family protein
MFSEQEEAYLRTQPLLRLATVAANGQPDADAVGFEFDGAQFFIGGHALERSRKYKNIVGGQQLVSLIIDDLETIKPWRPRGIKIHGRADIVQRQGQFGAGTYLAVTPLVSWSWGIEGDSFTDGKFTPKKIVWTANEAS